MSQAPSTNSSSDLPLEVRGWNWGAFFLNWIWGLGNGTVLGLLMFVPFVNLAIPFVMGAKGNRWAWENRKWQSVDQFKKVQRIWSWVGLGVWVALVGFLTAMFFIVRWNMEGSPVYRLSVAQLNQSSAAMSVLGAPMETEAPMGSLVDGGSTGKAVMAYEVRGPKGRGWVFFEGHKDAECWVIDASELEMEGSGERIDILASDSQDNHSP